MIKGNYRQNISKHRSEINDYQPLGSHIELVDARGSQSLGDLVLNAIHHGFDSLGYIEAAFVSLQTREMVVQALCNSLSSVGVARLDITRVADGRDEVRHLRLEQSDKFEIPGEA